MQTMKQTFFILSLVIGIAASGAEPVFFNIAPYSPGNEKRVAADMREYAARTGFKEVLYCLTLHPESAPAMKKVDEALASYRALRAELAGSDVRLGILLQAIMGHWPRTDKDVEPWERTIDIDGDVKRFCTLDGRYRDYIRTVARRLAEERPCFILGDDDIRAFCPKAECFCPRHVAEFNRRLGTDFSQEGMRKAVRESKPGDRVYETFMALQREHVLAVGKLIREGIDAVDPAIGSGACMPFWEYRFCHQTADVLAAKGQPALMRIANSNYLEREGSPNRFVETVQRTQSLYAFNREKTPVLLAEADTYPHDLWSRSSVSFHAHLVASLFTGLKGAKLWFVNAHKGPSEVSRNYTDILAENAGLYRALVDEMGGAEPLGLIEPCLTTFRRWHPVHDFHEAMTPERTWATHLVGNVGIPYGCAADYRTKRLWTLAGTESVGRLSDDELRQLLSGSVLVDGTAAVELTKRGFSELIGVTACEGGVMFNDERIVENGESVAYTKSDGAPVLVPAKGAKSLSELVYRPFAGAVTYEVVQPGATVFRNGLGGCVAVTAYNLDVRGHHRVSLARKNWLQAIVDELSGGPVLPCVENDQDVTALAARTKDGSVILLAINLNFDPIRKLKVRRPSGTKTVERLGSDGTWHPVDGDISLACYGLAVLRFR